MLPKSPSLYDLYVEIASKRTAAEKRLIDLTQSIMTPCMLKYTVWALTVLMGLP